MTNNKGFLITIPTFSADNMEDAAKAVSQVMSILYKNSANGYFEMPFSEGGIEVEVNTQESCYMEDGFIKGRVGDEQITIDPQYLT